MEALSVRGNISSEMRVHPNGPISERIADTMDARVLPAEVLRHKTETHPQVINLCRFHRVSVVNK